MSSKSSVANEKLTPIDENFTFVLGLGPWGLLFTKFIHFSQKTDLSAHYVKSFVFCFHFFLASHAPQLLLCLLFVWRHIEGFSLNGLQIYAVSTENAFNFRYFDDELQTLHDSQAEGVGKQHRLLIYLCNPNMIRNADKIGHRHLLTF